MIDKCNIPYKKMFVVQIKAIQFYCIIMFATKADYDGSLYSRIVIRLFLAGLLILSDLMTAITVNTEH